MRIVSLCLIVLVIFGASVTVLQSQEAACSAYLEQALAAVQDACGATGRNQACYGNFSMQATTREAAIILDFDARGDVANVADLQTLRLDGLNTEANTWGIALMKIQANLPDSLPGENVTFLLFGDVEIENAANSVASIAVTTLNASNVRQRPSTEATVIGSLTSGETVTADGRTADFTWLRVRLPDSDSLGWVSADLLQPTGDVATLSEVDPANDTVPFTPMQAFYFRSGASGTTCETAPQDGILIQTPEGVGQISLRANDVDIQLGSTAFIKAQPGGSMSFSILEGAGRARVDGEYIEVPAGSWVEIPMSDDLSASGAPSNPKPYNNDSLQRVPVQLLPREITITPSLTEEEIAAFLAAREDNGQGN
ncbi:MAG: SH3 domain-containing protein [Chloroflexi bacterium]|nr:SH3 domain-containing protein [Chloroflexota bacterium]